MDIQINTAMNRIDRKIIIANSKHRQRPLSMKDGKISVAMSLKNCRQCDKTNN